MSKREPHEAWKRAHRDMWFAEGFKAARDLGVSIVNAMAENEDWRPEEARIAGVKPSRLVRLLRRAGHNLRNMSRPARPFHQDVEGHD
jgi:hypothetical protein